MNKIIYIVIVVIVAMGGLTYYIDRNRSSSVITISSSPSTSSNISSTTASTNAITFTVSIENNTFKPGNQIISAGSTIRWVNNDAVLHSISGSTFKSSTLKQGEQFSYTFSATGTFPYACGVHPSMTGTITVE